MRFTYSDLLNQFLDNTGNTSASGTNLTNLTNFFQRVLSQRYQLALAEFDNPKSQVQLTASTVVGQQYYHNPAGIVNIESATVTVGSVSYPIIPVDSQLVWDSINETLISTTAIPKFIFGRRDDFGIWPTPQGVYTITLNTHTRDRSLTVADYTTGTVTATNNSTSITGSGTTWTTAMIGRWFTLNDATAQDQGQWYRIADVPATTTLTLETSYQGASVSDKTYRIGESPELPEEAHILLAAGCSADYYAGPRQDVAKGTWWNNVFWTGDGQNSNREGDFSGGILGLKERYAGRTDSAIIRHHRVRFSSNDKNWATTISS